MSDGKCLTCSDLFYSFAVNITKLVFSENDSSDHDDGSKWKEVKKEHKKIQREKRRYRDDESDEDESKVGENSKSSMVEMRDVDSFKINELSRKVAKASLGTRLAKEKEKPQVKTFLGVGNRQMSFSTEKPISRAASKRHEEMKRHREERKQVIRPTTFLKKRK